MLLDHKSPSGYHIISFPVGALQCNCSILWDTETKEALVVDPGGDFDLIKEELEKRELVVKGIIHTHAHFDHVGATKPLYELTKAPLIIHPGEKFLWDNVVKQGVMFGIPMEALPDWDKDLEDEMEMQCGKHKLKTLVTPGHTPGSSCFVIDDILFSGDTLFQNSIGRTDLPGGDSGQIVKSIKNRLYGLDVDTTVVCGHGPNTKIGIERRQNPFVSI
jgi:glyoxylase-like metal-dependent hydrolase (beta-lactamase superfamily II)